MTNAQKIELLCTDFSQASLLQTPHHLDAEPDLVMVEIWNIWHPTFVAKE